MSSHDSIGLSSSTIRSEIKNVVCFFCERLFLSEAALHKHLKTHVCDNSKPPCFCEECNPKEAVARVEEIYARFLNVEQHRIDRTSISYLNRLHYCKRKDFDNPIYRCHKCQTAFNGLAVFVKHMQKHALLGESSRMDLPTARNSLYYCPTCRLPYRATVPYIKHLKKHLIAVIRYDGIKEKGSEYDFNEESYDNSGSLQCPVTNCQKKPKTETAFIQHMEQHLSEMDSDVIFKNRVELAPVKGRPPVGSHVDGRKFPEVSSSSDSGRNGPSDVFSPADDEQFADSQADDSEDKFRDVLVCSECDLSFDKLSVGFRHKVDVHGYEVKSCSVCWRRLGSVDELIRHVESSHDESVGRNKKRTLEETFSVKDSDQTVEVSNDLSKDFDAEEPPRKAKQSSEGPGLSPSTHFYGRPETIDLSCRACKVEYARYSELLKHQHYVHGVSDKQCRLCNKFINSYPSLVGHVNACSKELS